MTSAILADLEPLAEPIDSLTPLPDNPRRGDVAAVMRSYEAFGQRKPIVARRSDRTVLAGNHQLAAARELGWDRIAVAWVDDDDLTAQAFALADNRTGDLGGYDDMNLALLLKQVADDPSLFAATGYDADDLRELLESTGHPYGALTDPDDVPEPPAEPVTRPGDVWLLGPHRLICGDCRDSDDVRRLFASEHAALAFTSPPYASQRRYDEASEFQPVHPDDYVDWFDAVQANVAEVLADDGSWLVDINAHADVGQRHLYVNDLTIAHARRWGWCFIDEFCWVDTKNGVPGAWPNRFKDAWEPVFHFARRTSGFVFHPLANATDSEAVFDYSPATAKTGTGSGLLGSKATSERQGRARPSNVVQVAASSARDHSAAFPVALPEWFIRVFSNVGSIVYDPFMGSGTTLVAAHREDRRAFGVEISPAYCDVICRRYQQHTGDTPILEATGDPHDFTQE